MADNAEPNGAEKPKQAAPVQLKILGQFIRDLSFENVVAMKGIAGEMTPDVNIQVSLDAKKRQAEKQYEISTKFKITARNKGTEDVLFLMELDYGGIFLVDNVPEDQLHPFLLIECPRMIFPFVRHVVHDVIREGGFPPLNLEPVDWVALYRQNLARQAEAAKAEPAQN